MNLCKVCGKKCEKEYCFQHKPKQALRKVALNKKVPLEEAKQATQERIQKDYNFYLGIWNKRPHRCQVCDTPLGSELRSYMFDHLIEKSTHPELRYEEDNLIVVCLDCHSKKTNGFINEKYQEFIDKAKEKFGK